MIGYALAFLLVIFLVTFVHEWGHYAMARLWGAHVQSFSIGFGKELYGYTDKRGCRWKFCLLPLGGFIKLAGDNSLFFGDAKDSEKGDFDLLSWWKQLLVIVGGPAANVFFAFCLFFAIFSLTNVVQVPPVVGSLIKGGPAELAGMQSGDRIQSINGIPIENLSDVASIIAHSTVADLTVSRQGEALHIKVHPRIEEGRHVLGIIGDLSLATSHRLSSAQAFISAGAEIRRFAVLPMQALYRAIVRMNTENELHSVIAIAGTTSAMLDMGLVPFLWFIAVLSVNLGVINLFPLLPLDGGRIVVVFLDAVFGNRAVGQTLKKHFMVLGIALVMTVMFVAVGNDIKDVIAKFRS